MTNSPYLTLLIDPELINDLATSAICQKLNRSKFALLFCDVLAAENLFEDQILRRAWLNSMLHQLKVILC